MTNDNSIVTLPKSALREREGVVLLPLKKWKKIEEDLEDLEMYRSQNLGQEIARRRAAKKRIPLTRLLKKYSI